jgi:biotin transport system substrate-specific component
MGEETSPRAGAADGVPASSHARSSTRDLTYIALFAALVAALGLFPQIQVGPVPITAQTLGVMLAGAILGARRAGLALLVFVVLVAVGLPVLAAGRGGLGVFAGVSGGFVLSWPIGAFVVGWLTERWWHRYTVVRGVAANIVGGIVVVYAIGIPHWAVLGDLGLVGATMSSAAFIPGDLLKAVLAALAAVGVRRAYPVIDR